MDYTYYVDQKETSIQFGYTLPPRFNSKCFARCSLCGTAIQTTRLAICRTLRKRGVYRCGLCIARSPEGRAARSSQSKKSWSNPEIATKIIENSSAAARSAAGRSQRSSQSKAAWENVEYASKQRQRISEKFKSEEHRNLVSERNRSQYVSDPDKYIAEKTSALWTPEARAAHKTALSNTEYRELHRQLALERFKNPEYKEKIANGLEGFPRGGKMSSGETSVQNLLSDLGVDFIYNKSIGPYNFDFYIPSLNLFIEVQGEYWHTLPNNERRDRSKYSYLRSSVPDSKIVYIWDFDIVNGEYTNKLKQAIGLASLPTLDFAWSDLSISEPSWNEAKKFLSSWHYAQFGKQGKMTIAAMLNDQIIALAKFSPVSRKEVATSIGSTPKETFELDRFCIHPMRQKKNFCSYFLSRASNMFFNRYPQCRSLVAFSDTTFGHDGTIYKASNWKEVSRVKPDYVYVRKDGWVMHKKTLYNQARSVHMLETVYASKHGWKKVFGKEKIKFVLTR
jgi:hypothetical protein